MVDHDKWLPGCFTETSRTVHKSSSDREPVECMVNPTQAKFVGFANQISLMLLEVPQNNFAT
jgi:hypothetical protein